MENRATGMSNLYNKFYSDSEFKANLLANPVPTLEAFTGKPFPADSDVSVVVEDQTDSNVIYLNIPANPANGRELTMEELEAIVGGDGLFYDIGYAIGQGARAVWDWATGN